MEEIEREGEGAGAKRRADSPAASESQAKKRRTEEEQLPAAGSVDVRLESRLDAAKRALQLSSHGRRTVGRAAEERQLRRFLEAALRSLARLKRSDRDSDYESESDDDSSGGEEAGGDGAGTGGRCLYVSGVPGTGKTSCVRQVLTDLLAASSVAKGSGAASPAFVEVFVNARKLAKPERVMSALYAALSGKKASPAVATRKLPALLCEPGPPVVLVVDEMDFLITRSQRELYTLADWPSRPSCRLVLVGIANTLDLPERLLIPRIASRFGNEAVAFPPYGRAQLQAIVEARVADTNAFAPDAVKFCSSSVAATLGDARHALNVCRHAVELAQLKGNQEVTLADVKEALTSGAGASPVAALAAAPLHARVFLCALLAELRVTSKPYALLRDVVRAQAALCSDHAVRKPSLAEAAAVCNQLAMEAIVLVGPEAAGSGRKVQLQAPLEDVVAALSLKEPTVGMLPKF